MKDQNIRKIIKGSQRNSFIEKIIAIIERPSEKRALMKLRSFCVKRSVVMQLKYQNDRML